MALGEDEGLGIAVGQLGVQPPDLQVGGQGISQCHPPHHSEAREGLSHRRRHVGAPGHPGQPCPGSWKLGRFPGKSRALAAAANLWSCSGFLAQRLWGLAAGEEDGEGPGGDGLMGLLQGQEPFLVTHAGSAPDPERGQQEVRHPGASSGGLPAPAPHPTSDGKLKHHRKPKSKFSQAGSEEREPECENDRNQSFLMTPHAGRELLSPGPPLRRGPGTWRTQARQARNGHEEGRWGTCTAP